MLGTILSIILDIAVMVILLFASKEDVKTRIVPPKIQIALAVCSVLNLLNKFFIIKDVKDAVNCLITGIGLFLIYIIFVLVGKGGIGGADTKVSSLLALFLGLKQTIILMLTHCIVAIIYTAYRFIKHKEQLKSVPLMPFLAIGFFVARLVYWITIII